MTRQQAWAAAALAAAGRYKAEKDTKKRDELRTLCMKLPVLVQQSGLVQAVAFLRSRGESGQRLWEDVTSAFGSRPEEKAKAKDTPTAGQRLQEKAQGTDDLLEYMALTRDVMSIAVWFRRFAQSELPRPAGHP